MDVLGLIAYPDGHARGRILWQLREESAPAKVWLIRETSSLIEGECRPGSHLQGSGSLSTIEACYILPQRLGIWMLFPQHLLADGQRSLKQRTSLVVMALLGQHSAQIVESNSSVGMLFSVHLLADGQSLLVQGTRPLVVALLGKHS